VRKQNGARRPAPVTVCENANRHCVAGAVSVRGTYGIACARMRSVIAVLGRR
jgi:hypothetical protein